jgi:hypothetical protein
MSLPFRVMDNMAIYRTVLVRGPIAMEDRADFAHGEHIARPTAPDAIQQARPHSRVLPFGRRTHLTPARPAQHRT